MSQAAATRRLDMRDGSDTYYRSAYFAEALWDKCPGEPIYDEYSQTMVLNDISESAKSAFQDALNNGKIQTVDVASSGLQDGTIVPLSMVDRFGLPFGTFMRLDTGLIITSPMLSDVTIAKYYEDYYHELNYGTKHIGNVGSLFDQGQGKKIWGIVSRYFPNNVERLRVLEIGMGLGDVLHGIQDEAIKVGIDVDCIGTEYNQGCMESASEKGIRNIYGGLDEAVGTGDTYDLVILSHVFEHFIDLELSLDKLKELLSPDGLLYIEVPGVMALHRNLTYEYDYNLYSTHAHCYNFNLTSLVSVLARGGFDTLFGNEQCEAVFRISNKEGAVDGPLHTEKNASAIYSYLLTLHAEKPYFSDIAARQRKITQEHFSYKRQLDVSVSRVNYLERVYYSRILILRRLIGLFIPGAVKNVLEKYLLPGEK